MRLATTHQCREIDKLSQSEYQLSDEMLMEAAGSSAARETDQTYYPELKTGTVAIVCGPGHNGADGLVMARHLHSMGHRDVVIYYFVEGTPLFARQLKRAQLQGLRIFNLSEQTEKIDQIKSSRLIVDALFGVGLSRAVEEPYRSVIDLINSVKVPKISLDIPSGLDGDTGIVQGAAVRAQITLTFGLAKPGFFVAEGPMHVGRLRTLPIGFPYEALRSVATTHFAFNEKLARRYLPKRSETSNKSQHGHTLVIAGNRGTWGAAVLCAGAAYRMGTGYVTLASRENTSELVSQIPEVLTADLTDLAVLKNEKYTAIAVGPGLGVDKQTAEIIQTLKSQGHRKVILDADALTACVQFDLFPLPKHWIITPHVGELSRLIKVDADAINANRFYYARQAASQLGCHVLLKGFRTILSYEERCMVILAGNSALAKAGTGDVLTGMIGGLLAQGLPTLQGAATAAYIHGRMADEWIRIGNDKRSLNASDLRDHLPNLMGRLAGGALI